MGTNGKNGETLHQWPLDDVQRDVEGCPRLAQTCTTATANALLHVHPLPGCHQRCRQRCHQRHHRAHANTPTRGLTGADPMTPLRKKQKYVINKRNEKHGPSRWTSSVSCSMNLSMPLISLQAAQKLQDCKIPAGRGRGMAWVRIGEDAAHGEGAPYKCRCARRPAREGPLEGL